MYQPPPGNNVTLRFNEAYTPPAGDNVALQFHGKMVFAGSGGAVVGGSAESVGVNIQVSSHAASGGAIVGGQSSSFVDRAAGATGGAVSSGSAVVNRSRELSSVGGGITGGVALIGKETSILADGGAIAGGSADMLAERRNILVLGDGGGICSGTSLIEAINLQVAAMFAVGGGVTAGEAGTNRESSTFGAGGAVGAQFPQSGWVVIDGIFDAAIDLNIIETMLSGSTAATVDYEQFSASREPDVDVELDLEEVVA